MSDNVEIPRLILKELVECLEEAQQRRVGEELEHRITLALDDHKTATWEPIK